MAENVHPGPPRGSGFPQVAPARPSPPGFRPELNGLPPAEEAVARLDDQPNRTPIDTAGAVEELVGWVEELRPGDGEFSAMVRPPDDPEDSEELVVYTLDLLAPRDREEIGVGTVFAVMRRDVVDLTVDGRSVERGVVYWIELADVPELPDAWEKAGSEPAVEMAGGDERTRG